MADIIAVDDEGLNANTVALNSKISEISENLEKFKAIVDDISIEGDLKNSISQKVIDIENNFPTIISNLEGYVKDLIIVRDNYSETSKSISLSKADIISDKGGEIIHVNEI